MTEIKFPPIDEFYVKFCKAVKQSGAEQQFVTKWGLRTLSDVYDILNNNVQGGYDSHKKSMLTNRTGAWNSVLTIGPGMGFCGFLLSELYDFVYVAEPDGENCSLLQGITNHYRTGKGKIADDIIKIFHAGIAITDEAVKYWETKRMLMKKRSLKGSILNFDIKGAAELGDVFHQRVSRIYLHKVLSSFSISGSFDRIIAQCAALLAPKGIITWSEPDYIFDDILMAGLQQPIDTVLKPVFHSIGMNFHRINYEVSNTGSERGASLVEKWALIQTWKRGKRNEKR